MKFTILKKITYLIELKLIQILLSLIIIAINNIFLYKYVLSLNLFIHIGNCQSSFIFRFNFWKNNRQVKCDGVDTWLTESHVSWIRTFQIYIVSSTLLQIEVNIFHSNFAVLISLLKRNNFILLGDLIMGSRRDFGSSSLLWVGLINLWLAIIIQH